MQLSTLSAAGLLAGCFGKEFEKHNIPLGREILAEMQEIDTEARDPIFMRIFKTEAELEVWKQTAGGDYALLKTYEICAWSGDLGPKFQEGDRQAPEGFYFVSPALMNPNSSFHLSFNLGFPNAFDRSHGRTGSFLMVHGACSSAGCYSMEDDQIEEIYGLAREAFLGGQRDFQVQAFPFRMTPEKMAIFSDNEHMPFWRMLKEGYEHFELTRKEPAVAVCGKRYVFNAEPLDDGVFNAEEACPVYEVAEPIQTAVSEKIAQDRVLEDLIVASWQTSEERKYQELVMRLEIEQARVKRFTDRDLGVSRHQKARLANVQAQLVDLGYTPDGTRPVFANFPQEGADAPQPTERPALVDDTGLFGFLTRGEI